MKRSLLFFSLVFLISIPQIEAQKKRRPQTQIKKPLIVSLARENASTAIVVDERLAVLRETPSLFAKPIQRMRRGRLVAISGYREADGVRFYRVNVPPANYGWVQSEAVV